MTHYTVQFNSAIPELATVASLDKKVFNERFKTGVERILLKGKGKDKVHLYSVTTVATESNSIYETNGHIRLFVRLYALWRLQKEIASIRTCAPVTKPNDNISHCQLMPSDAAG